MENLDALINLTSHLETLCMPPVKVETSPAADFITIVVALFVILPILSRYCEYITSYRIFRLDLFILLILFMNIVGYDVYKFSYIIKSCKLGEVYKLVPQCDGPTTVFPQGLLVATNGVALLHKLLMFRAYEDKDVNDPFYMYAVTLYYVYTVISWLPLIIHPSGSSLIFIKDIVYTTVMTALFPMINIIPFLYTGGRYLHRPLRYTLMFAYIVLLCLPQFLLNVTTCYGYEIIDPRGRPMLM